MRVKEGASMQKPVDEEWVWIIVERDKTDEQILGRLDEQRQDFFIPVFRSKDEGLRCLERMDKKADHCYQLQAMRFGEVAQAVRQSQFMIYFLGGGGEILDRISFKQ
jgi:hypothetical protein